MRRAKSQVDRLAGPSIIAHRGISVKILDVTGRLHQRIIWESDDLAVYGTDADGYKRLLAGKYVVPIGFRRSDVYEIDERAMNGENISSLREWNP